MEDKHLTYVIVIKVSRWLRTYVRTGVFIRPSMQIDLHAVLTATRVVHVNYDKITV